MEDDGANEESTSMGRGYGRWSSWSIYLTGSTSDLGRQYHLLRSPVARVLISSQSGSKNILGWQQIPSSEFASSAAVGDAIVDERAWIAIVIEQNASNNLINARANGDTSYNPMNAISVYYAQGRNEIGTGSYAVPITQTLITQLIGKFSAQTTGQYLSQVASNTTAIQNLARAPLTISQPVFYTIRNLRPFSTQTATAITLVGQIYVCIFAFFITMAGGTSSPFHILSSLD